MDTKKIKEKIDQMIDDIWCGREYIGISTYEQGECQALRDLKEWINLEENK